MKPVEIVRYLNDKDFIELKEYASKIYKNFDENKYYSEFGRFDTIFEIPENFKNKITNRLNSELNLENEIVYCQLIKYQSIKNNIPKLNEHKDKLPCEISISLVLEKNMDDWGLCVENYTFKDEENKAVIFNGRQSVHYRPEYKNKNGHLVLLLIHTASKEFLKNNINAKTVAEYIKHMYPVYTKWK